MRILHVINNLGSGGAEKVLTDVLPLMKQRGHEVMFCICNGKKNVEKYESILQDADISIFNFNVSFYNPFVVIKLVRIIKKHNYDIIHSHLFPTKYWLAIASLFLPKRVRLVTTEHSVFNNRRKYGFLKPLEKFVYGRYDAIIGISTSVKKNLEQWLGLDSVVIINNGLPLSEIRASAIDGKGRSTQISNDDNYKILMTGRFDGYAKDQKTLIDAIDLLPYSVNLYFAGEGPYLQKVKQYTQQKERITNIHFLGMRQDIYNLMAQVDLNVLSSNYEGQSGVALEAMASGTPFIGSDVPGINDVVPDTSFLFPKGDPKGLAEKIDRVKNDTDFRERLVEKGLEHSKKYDIKMMTSNLLHLYQSVLPN